MGKIKFGLKAAGDLPVGRMIASQLRHPGVMLPVILSGTTLIWGAVKGWALPLAVGVALLVALGVWRLAWPASFHGLVFLRVKAWYRRWLVYSPRWWFWMGRLGLSLTDEVTEWIVRPRILKVRSTDCMDSLLVDLPIGIVPSQVAEVADKLKHAARVRRASTRESLPGRVWLDLYTSDPLVKPIPALPVPESLRIEDLDGLVIGYCEDGSPWRLKVRGRHVLVVGVTGAGKSSVLWSVIRALLPYIAAGLVEIHAIDPKGGMELEWGAPLFKKYERDGYEEMAELLESDADYLDDRARMLRGKARKFTATKETPFVLIIIDELMQLTALLPGSEGRRISARVETAMGRLLSKGRGPGYGVLATVIEPTKDIVQWRDLFTDKVALRLETAQQVDMVMGEGQRDAGAECDSIPASLPGVGYVKLEGVKEPMRVRAAYVSDDDITAMAAKYSPLGTSMVGDLALVDANTVSGELIEGGEAA